MTEMTSTKEKEGTRPPTQKGATEKDSSSPLQWFRELIAGAISVAILAIAVLMMHGTYKYAKESPIDGNAAAVASRKEAYDRQKDIMLYALALLGTVTGYYLGRVPAELHAQNAQRSAQTAQGQLQETQTKLTDTAGSAAAAAREVVVVQGEKYAAETKLSKAVDVLDRAREVASTASRAAMGSKTLGGGAGGTQDAELEKLRTLAQDIEIALKEIRSFR